MTIDPSLDFWLRAAEHDGALHESAAGVSVVLLPPALRAAFDLTEEVTVTADPEVAREDGALLLAPGHPVLDRAAERVLDQGDVGRAPLAWPSAALPSAETLVARLREQVPVDHGRIDPTGELPLAGYAPVLRVGALVTYTVTLEDRFQERSEVWVDADSGLALTAQLTAGLAAAPSSAGMSHAVLPVDRGRAASAAHLHLEQRADERLAVLAKQSRAACDVELARVGDYYRAALDSLAKRSAAARADRQQLLDARARATRAERERRLAEVEEKYRGSHSIRWFRLHELLVPAARVPVTVRRGSREYPFSFRWLLPLQSVAPYRCPHCAAAAPLVAGKHRLGCAQCLGAASPAEVPPPRTPQPRARAAAEASPADSASIPAARQGSSARPVPAPVRTSGPAPSAPASRPRPSPASGPARSTPRQPVPAPFDGKRCAQDGNRLALRFWEEVVRDDRRLGRLVVPGSPAAAALRVWGAFGPALVLGVAAGGRLQEVDATTVPAARATLQATEGWLRSPTLHYPYVLRWQGQQGRPGAVQVAEVLSGRPPSGPRLSGHAVRSWWRDPSRVRPLPPPLVALDPVAAALWRVELPERGPYLLLRCLAAWWRTQPELDASSADAAAVAAAVARQVATCAGTQLSYDAVGRQYAADPAEIRAVMVSLRGVLALDGERGW